MMFGLDYLLGSNYPKRIKLSHPKGAAAGFILNTNKPTTKKTNARPIVEDLFESDNCPAQRVHAVWADDHQYRPKQHDKIIMAELEWFSRLQEQLWGHALYFSPVCEMDTRGAIVDKLFDRIMANKHEGLFVVNSVNKGQIRPNLVNEVHGNHPNPGGQVIYSTDGNQSWDMNIQAKKREFKNAALFMHWFSMCNGKFNDKAPNEQGADTTPRPNRQAWPTEHHIASTAFQFGDPGAVSLGARHIWKTHADQHSKTKPAPREGKPVFITPVTAKEINLVASNGKVVGIMKREPNNFVDGRSMYRLKEFGYLVAQKAKGTVTLVANGEKIGVVNPGFRLGF